MDEASQLAINSKLNLTIGIAITKVATKHKVTYFENCLSLFIWITSTIWHITLGQGNCVNQNNIQNLQTWALRKITFKKFHDPVNPLYKDLKILKFKDLLHLQTCLFVLQIEQNQTPAKSFVTPLNIVMITITTKHKLLL